MPVQKLTYRQIADDLTERIRQGEYAAGAQLPSYAQLAKLYDVSVSTSARAVALLVDRGVIVSQVGRGLFVPDEDDATGTT